MHSLRWAQKPKGCWVAKHGQLNASCLAMGTGTGLLLALNSWIRLKAWVPRLPVWAI